MIEIKTLMGLRVTIVSVVHCGLLEAPAFGTMSTNDTACGTKTRFACDECYDRIGNSSLTCLPNGEWDNLVPTCQCNCALPYLW